MLTHIFVAVVISVDTVSAADTVGSVDVATDQVFSWREIDRQIVWHRQRVRWCGPLAVVRTLKILGHDIDSADLLDRYTGGDERGVSVQEVLSLCREYESQAHLVSLPNKQWRRLIVPCILIVNQRRHALVLQSVSHAGRTARIWDPSVMHVRTIGLDQLRDMWSGDAILLKSPPWSRFAFGVAGSACLAAILWRRYRSRRAPWTGR